MPFIKNLGPLYVKIVTRAEGLQEIQGLQRLKDSSFPFKTPPILHVCMGNHLILLSPNCGKTLGHMLSEGTGVSILDSFLGEIETEITEKRQRMSLNNLPSPSPWERTQNMFQMIPPEEEHPALLWAKDHWRIPAFTYVWEEHGDMHLENLLVKGNGEIFLIDPIYGTYPVVCCYLKMICQWVLLYSTSHNGPFSEKILDMILDSARTAGCASEMRYLLPSTLLRLKYIKTLQPRFHYLCSNDKSSEIDYLLDYLWNQL